MGQAYSDPKRKNDPYALPDLTLWPHSITLKHAQDDRANGA
jgi:hypothetical protein